MGNATRKDSTARQDDENRENAILECPPSEAAPSRVGGAVKERRSSSSATSTELPVQKRSGSPMAGRRAEAAEVGGSACSSGRRFLTVDHERHGARKVRPRSMSAKKSDELRPHPESSPRPAVGGSVRMRRTSETVNEIGQLKLTPGQMALVRRLWQNVRTQGKNGAGLQILRDHLFFRYPDIRESFSKPSNAGAGASVDVSYHRRLMAHAEALGDLLDEVVVNLEQSDLLRDKIRELGRVHVKYRDVGFKASYWDYLAEAFNECTLEWCQRSQRSFETQVAMMTIVMFIVDHLKDGYMDECRRLRRSVYDSGSRERKHESRDVPRSPRRVASSRND